MKNVLIVSCVFPPEPIVSAMISFDISSKLAEKNIVTVLSPRPTRPHGFIFENLTPIEYSFKHTLIDSYTHSSSSILGRFRESISFGLKCASYIKRNEKNIDCLYLNSWPLFSQFFIVRAAKKRNIPTITHVQDIYPESIANKLPKILSWLLMFCFKPIDIFVLRNSSIILGISDNAIAYLKRTRKINDNKFHLIRNWQDDEIFLQSPLKVEKDFFEFMFIGSVVPSANVETLIYAFDNVKLKNSRLTIAGSGSDKEKCKEIVSRLRNDNIVFCNVSREDVPIIQSRADVLLLSLKKGIAKTATPSKLTAYMMSGKPIIAAVDKESDTESIIINSDCGIVVEPENSKDMEVAMEFLFNKKNQEKVTEYGINARAFAVKYLSKKVNLDKIINVFDKTLEN